MENLEFERSRFKSLMGLGNFLNGIGVLLVVGAIMLGLWGWIQYQQTKQLIGLANPWIFVSIYAFFFGLMLSAIGQLISCFVSIENNTHAALQIQQAMFNAAKSQREIQL